MAWAQGGKNVFNDRRSEVLSIAMDNEGTKELFVMKD